MFVMCLVIHTFFSPFMGETVVYSDKQSLQLLSKGASFVMSLADSPKDGGNSPLLQVTASCLLFSVLFPSHTGVAEGLHFNSDCISYVFEIYI